MMASNIKNPENRKLCDILILNGPNIKYISSDFNKATEIYNEGKVALKDAIPSLVKIPERLKNYKQRDRSLPIGKDSIVLDSVIFSGISKENLNLVKASSGLATGKKYTKDEIIKGINKAMGTALFSDVDYSLVEKPKGTELFINAKERSNHQVKGAIHYNNDQDAGLILNYTGRNILGNSSRSIISVDIAKNPKIRLQQQNILGKNKKWWMRTEAFGSSYRQGLFLSGFKVDEVKYRFLKFGSQLNRNINTLKSYVGIGIDYENSRLKPTVPPELVSQDLSLTKYEYKTLLLSANFRYNNHESQYFPTKGSNLEVTYKKSVFNNLEVNTTEADLIKVSGKLNNYHKFILNASTRLPITRKSTAITGVTTAFVFEDSLDDDEYSYLDYGIGIQYFLGGSTLLARSDSFTVPGLKEGEALASQFTKLNFGLQYALHKKVFLTPHVDVVFFGTGSFSDYFENIGKTTSNWAETENTGLIISSGLTASYNSILGPISVDASFVNGIDKVRFFVGVGYSFIAI